MTSLDKVFIKAYGKSVKATSQSPVREPISPPGHRVDASHLPPPPPHTATPEPAPALQPAPVFHSPDQGRIDARHELSKPHWPPALAKAGVAKPEPSVVKPAEPVTVAAPSIVNEQPATQAVQEKQPEEPQAEASSTRAAFEVDRFLWPELCHRLHTAANWSGASRELSAASREGQQIFVITSQHRGEGRSTLALCLALRLAEKHLRVTLVDADFHRPQLARQLKLLPACTWDDGLRGSLPLTESWIESVEDGVTLLPLKERADITGLPGNPRLKELFSLLRRTNDVVLIDAGSLEDFTDREVLALLGGTAQVDGALILRDVRKTPVAELEQAPKFLDSLGIGRVDVVENFVK